MLRRMSTIIGNQNCSEDIFKTVFESEEAEAAPQPQSTTEKQTLANEAAVEKEIPMQVENGDVTVTALSQSLSCRDPTPDYTYLHASDFDDDMDIESGDAQQPLDLSRATHQKAATGNSTQATISEQSFEKCVAKNLKVNRVTQENLDELTVAAMETTNAPATVEQPNNEDNEENVPIIELLDTQLGQSKKVNGTDVPVIELLDTQLSQSKKVNEKDVPIIELLDTQLSQSKKVNEKNIPVIELLETQESQQNSKRSQQRRKRRTTADYRLILSAKEAPTATALNIFDTNSNNTSEKKLSLGGTETESQNEVANADEIVNELNETQESVRRLRPRKTDMNESQNEVGNSNEAVVAQPANKLINLVETQEIAPSQRKRKGRAATQPTTESSESVTKQAKSDPKAADCLPQKLSQSTKSKPAATKTSRTRTTQKKPNCSKSSSASASAKVANYVVPKVMRYYDNSRPNDEFNEGSASISRIERTAALYRSLLPPVYPPHFKNQIILTPQSTSSDAASSFFGSQQNYPNSQTDALSQSQRNFIAHSQNLNAQQTNMFNQQTLLAPQSNGNYHQTTAMAEQPNPSNYHQTTAMAQPPNPSNYQQTMAQQPNPSNYHQTMAQQPSPSNYQQTMAQQPSPSNYHQRTTLAHQPSSSNYHQTTTMSTSLNSHTNANAAPVNWPNSLKKLNVNQANFMNLNTPKLVPMAPQTNLPIYQKNYMAAAMHLNAQQATPISSSLNFNVPQTNLTAPPPCLLPAATASPHFLASAAPHVADKSIQKTTELYTTYKSTNITKKSANKTTTPIPKLTSDNTEIIAIDSSQEMEDEAASSSSPTSNKSSLSLRDFFEIDEINDILDVEKVIFPLNELHVNALALLLNISSEDLFEKLADVVKLDATSLQRLVDLAENQNNFISQND